MPKNKRKQRNFGGIPGFGDDPNGINPGDMWNVFETGTILLESDEGKKTTVRVVTVYYRSQLPVSIITGQNNCRFDR